ncbi:MAG TPA: class I SAM-dependent methyltransferase [Gemmatimonadaceae bacterium]|nr:class I SAM-dependent methyltransferase [Gemmatimonadaceae bacterium]
MARDAAHKAYDRAYFDRWYRDPRTRVIRPGDVERKARLAVGAAEYLLGRPVRTVLDVGAGEGTWRRALRAIRPRIQYVGVDPSEYAVRRYGTRRGIRLGRFDALDELGLDGPFDLVVCVGVMNYLTTRELERGLESIAAMLGGVAFLEIWTSVDDIVGDRQGWQEHPPAYYLKHLRRAGLVPCGLHCYAGPTLAEQVAALEGGFRL